MKSALFLIEGGKALDLVKAYIAERDRVAKEVAVLAEQLGVTIGTTCRFTGVLLNVKFPYTVHAEFTKPDHKGMSQPRIKSAWGTTFRLQKGYANSEFVIAQAFDVVTRLSYTMPSGCGTLCIGRPFDVCGFLYPAWKGPYAVYIPDVLAEAAALRAQGYTVTTPIPDVLQLEGCKRILHEEWDIIVAQEKIKLIKGGHSD